MTKRFLAFILLFLTSGFGSAQDMPPLPPLPDQTISAGGTATVSTSPPLPPLPGQETAPANNGAPPLPPLPGKEAAPANNNSAPPLPPLPGQEGAPAEKTSAPALPPLPGEKAPDAPAGTAASAPAEGQSPAVAAEGEVKPVKKVAKEPRPWEATKWRPNVIFGGWVNAKGGNESSRIAWATQEVLNALVFKGYKVIKEEGKYAGQAGAGGNQWREITFSVPKSKLTVQVYAKQSGKRIWLRVGPSEPPAFSVYSIAQVKKMREADLKALNLIKKKLGRRLLPHRVQPSWEAPYSFAQEKVVE